MCIFDCRVVHVSQEVVQWWLVYMVVSGVTSLYNQRSTSSSYAVISLYYFDNFIKVDFLAFLLSPGWKGGLLFEDKCGG